MWGLYEGIFGVCVREYVGFVRGSMWGMYEVVCGVCMRVSGTCVYEGY